MELDEKPDDQEVCLDCDLPLPEPIEWSEGTSMFVFEDRRGRCLCGTEEE